jgi:hypothetical protein
MTSREFCYWLQGLFELTETNQLSFNQTQAIKNHLNMVFIHEIDPSYEKQEELNNAHNKPPKAPSRPPANPGFEGPLMRC